MEPPPPNRRRTFYLAFAIGALTFLLFAPTFDFPYINYDDNLYITDNLRTQQGLTGENVRWAFTTGYPSNWHPLTWLSHMLDVTLFGLDSGWHHFTNVLFHTLNSVLLFLVLRSLTRAPWRSAAVAALFAWHPLHVESVAWIAERKDVLAGFFWILAMGAYGRYTRSTNALRYLLLLILMTLGLMAKSMVVTLPCVFLLLDYWPLQRISFDNAAWKKRAVVLLAEKAPFFALSIAAGVIAISTQGEGGAMRFGDQLSLPERIANAIRSYGIYLWKTIWPAELAVYYPHPGSWPWWHIALAAVVLLLVSAAAYIYRKRHPFISVGWLWYLGTLVPVIGLIQVGGQAYANRYTYIPLIGIFIIAAWGAPILFRRLNMSREALIPITGAILLLCLWRTSAEVRYWRSSEALFARTIQLTEDNTMAYTAMGDALINQGKYLEAILYLDKAIDLSPTYMEAHINLGKAYFLRGEREKAKLQYMTALSIDENQPRILYNLGIFYLRDKEMNKAQGALERAIEADPRYANAYAALGFVLNQLGEYDEAVARLKKADTLQPDREDVLSPLASSYMALGKHAQAVDAYARLVQAAPDDPIQRLNYAVALTEIGQVADARNQAQRALELDPQFERARIFLKVIDAASPVE